MSILSPAIMSGMTRISDPTVICIGLRFRQMQYFDVHATLAETTANDRKIGSGKLQMHKTQKRIKQAKDIAE